MIDLYQGDALEIMDELIQKGVKVDAVITDPPYGTIACSWDSVIPFDKMWERLNKLIKSNGAVVLFGSEPFSSYLRLSNIKNYRYDWIWHKNTGGTFILASKMPMKRHEIISVFYNKQPTYNPQMEEYSESTKKRFKQGGMVKRNTKKITNSIHGGFNEAGIRYIDHKKGKYPTSVKFFKRLNTSNSQSFHPTQKPVDLMKYLIETYTNPEDTVLDFTMGSGSTGVACKLLNRKFIGIELDPKYFKIAEQRINKAQNKVENAKRLEEW